MTSSNKNTKILFTDLDGTLFDDQKNICPENRNAIKQALLAGHKIVITTGRPLFSAKKLCEELHLTEKGCYCICFNGAVIYDCFAQKAVYKKTLSHESVRRLMDEAQKAHLHSQTYSDTHVISELSNDDFDQYASICRVAHKTVPDVLKELGSNQAAKVLLIGDHEILEQFRIQTLPWREGKIDALFSFDRYLEFVSKDVSKGNAIKILCDILDLPLSASIAVGDAENDISMIQTAHIGAVMVNAPDTIKFYGNYVTTLDNNHGGVAEIIERFMLKTDDTSEQ